MRVVSCPGPAETRPFGLLDLMILVVACAPAIVVLRDRYESFRGLATPDTYRTVEAFHAAANILLMAATMSLAVMVLARARSATLLTRPGPAACLAAAAAVVVMVTRLSLKTYAMLSGPNYGPFLIRYIYPQVGGRGARVGFAVLGAWAALLMTRGWRPQPSWLDRAGRALGLAWIAMALLHLILPWIQAYLPAI
jgi:hypothetical protein